VVLRLLTLDRRRGGVDHLFELGGRALVRAGLRGFLGLAGAGYGPLLFFDALGDLRFRPTAGFPVAVGRCPSA
jgi:hypothetical protein